jgi:hypothetical protein
MKIQGTYTFDAPQPAVWQALQDPAVLTRVLPGCERLEKTGDNEYEGALKIKVGPVQGDFAGKILLADLDPPNGYSMTIDGRGAPGFVKAQARLSLAPDGDRTTLTYDSDAQVGGRVASVGQRLLDSSAKAIIKQSLEGLNAVLASRSGAAPTAGGVAAPAAAEPAPPSQAEFAARVAREVAKDLIPRPVLWGLLVAVALLLLYLFLWR